MPNDELQRQLTKLTEDVSETKTLVREINTRLFDPRIGLEVRVNDLESSRDKGKGVLWLFSFVASVSGLAELFRWVKH